MGQIIKASAQQGQPAEGDVMKALFEAFKPGSRNSGMEMSPQEFTDTPQFLAGRLRTARQMAESMGKPGDNQTFTAGVGLPELGVGIRVRYKAGEPAILIVQEKEHNPINAKMGIAHPNMNGQNGPSALYKDWVSRGLMNAKEYRGDGYYTTAAYEVSAKGNLRRLDPKQVNYGEFGLGHAPGSRFTGTGKPSFEPTLVKNPGPLDTRPFGPDGNPLNITPEAKPPARVPAQPGPRKGNQYTA